MFSIYSESYSQHNVIYFSEFDIYLTPQKCTDTLKYFFGDSSYILIKLHDCEGASSFVIYNNKKDIKSSGFYSKSLDTLKKYVSVYDYSGNLVRIEVLKYFEPLKESDWYYYENKKLIRKEKYKLGVKLKE